MNPRPRVSAAKKQPQPIKLKLSNGKICLGKGLHLCDWECSYFICSPSSYIFSSGRPTTTSAVSSANSRTASRIGRDQTRFPSPARLVPRKRRQIESRPDTCVTMVPDSFQASTWNNRRITFVTTSLAGLDLPPATSMYVELFMAGELSFLRTVDIYEHCFSSLTPTDGFVSLRRTNLPTLTNRILDEIRAVSVSMQIGPQPTARWPCRN